MKISNLTIDVIKNFSTINTNLLIKPGKTFSTMAPSKDIMAEFEGDDDFDKKIGLFNANEFLAVISTFNDPEVDLKDKFMTIVEGKQKVKYVYADESLLTVPKKSIAMPAAEIKFDLSEQVLSRIQKMAGILGVDDLAIIGDGDKIIARVFDEKNPTGNQLDIDMETDTTENFCVIFKVDKLKLFGGQDYSVEISSKKISKFSAKNLKLVYYIAIETTSVFN